MPKRRASAPGLALALAGCAGSTPAPPSAGGAQTHHAVHAAPGAAAEGEPYAWQPSTRSPQTNAPEGALAARCSHPDAALERVAAYIAARGLRGIPALDAEDVSLVLRAEGAPYVWPRTWTLSGEHAAEAAPGPYAEWLRAQPITAQQRCGVAVASDAGGRDVVAAVAVDVLADLDPLPTRVNIGAWLDVHAELYVPATGARVLVLAPTGPAQSVPSSFDEGHVRARFHAARAGRYELQILAAVEGGPRPVAEAVVFAGEAPSSLRTAPPAPGELDPHSGPPARVLLEMVNRAREVEGVRPLSPDVRLARVAQAHADAMRAAARLAHDVGDGTPSDRLEAAGLSVQIVGENVAHAANVRHAHRTLWQSLSHRSNLLESSYDSIGIGVAEDADGSLWVVELFARTAGDPDRAQLYR
ncbi:MAG TPA: CAP domain-containing protein [Polyangiaceae bacterium]|jgi:uncharacterized protein YkwD|nr:CAP domain-containing protein [Polyangiaceae bacterium]